VMAVVVPCEDDGGVGVVVWRWEDHGGREDFLQISLPHMW
jgi:hypothetical protein